MNVCAAILSAAFAALFLPSASRAEEPLFPATPAPDARATASRSDPSGCAPRVAQYAAPNGFTLWVVRKGTLIPDNPLRPLTRDPLLVLDVVAEGRSATAFGPDAGHLRQGGPARALEEESAAPIRWEGAGKALPATLTIRAGDGRDLGTLAFVGCGDAPRVTQPRPSASRDARPRGRERSVPPGLQLPRGAIE